MTDDLRTPLLVLSSLSIGFGAAMAVRLFLNVGRRYVWDLWPAITITGVLISANLIGKLVHDAPAVPPTSDAWVYAVALTIQSIGLIGWTFSRRGGRRRGD